MEASGRRWAAAGLGLVAIATGVGCWHSSWWVAAMMLKPTAAGTSAAAPPGLGLVEWAGRIQALQVGGLLLVGFGMVAWLLALNHWLWEGERRRESRPGEAVPGPRFLEPDRRA